MVFASLLSCLLPLKYKDDEIKDFANLLDDCVFSAENSVWHVISMESFLLLFLKKEDVVVESFSRVRAENKSHLSRLWGRRTQGRSQL